MKDRQNPSLPPTQQIPIISPVLHYFAMPAIVFWRHDFGYSYLRPKSVFLASTFASMPLAYIVFHEPGLKPVFGSIAAFTLLVSALYLIHLCRSVGSELARSAEHDQFSGISYLLRFWPKSQRVHQEKFLHTVAEPALTVLGGMIASFFGHGLLGGFLVFSGAILAAKESLNGWLSLRRQKTFRDQLDDLDDEMPEPKPQRESAPTNGAFRKQRVKRERKTGEGNNGFDAEEFRHAQALRLIPPYTLEAATANYRLLIQQVHPDLNADNDAAVFTNELNNAIEYFRSKSDAT